MNVGNLLLEGGVYESVALERVEALELGGDDDGGKGLTTAACRFTVSPWNGMDASGEKKKHTRHVSHFDMCGLQALSEGLAQTCVCDLRHCVATVVCVCVRVMRLIRYHCSGRGAVGKKKKERVDLGTVGMSSLWWGRAR